MLEPVYKKCPKCGEKTVKVIDTDMWSDYTCENPDCDYYKMVNYD